MNNPVSAKSDQDLAHLRPQQTDEIDLGELIRNLMAQWKLIGSITVAGALLSIVFALTQPKVYQVDAVIKAPPLAAISELKEQTLIGIDQTEALSKTAEALVATNNQAQVYSSSDLKKLFTKNSELSNEQQFLAIQEQLTITRIDNELFTAEVPPILKELKVSMQSSYPAAATNYVNELSQFALSSAKATTINDIATAKAERILTLKEQIKAETAAAKASRLAEITRLEASHALQLKELELQLQLLEQKATAERTNKIEQLEEAIRTATELKITEPVTWDDLRKRPLTAQIFNELDNQTKEEPTYFQGTRLLKAEVAMLKARENDLLFVPQAADIQYRIAAIKADPKLAALKAREDDTAYISNFEDLQMRLAKLESQPTEFSNVEFAEIVQPAVVPVSPIKPNKKLIVVAGTVLAGFLGLFIALLAIAIKPKRG